MVLGLLTLSNVSPVTRLLQILISNAHFPHLLGSSTFCEGLVLQTQAASRISVMTGTSNARSVSLKATTAMQGEQDGLGDQAVHSLTLGAHGAHGF